MKKIFTWLFYLSFFNICYAQQNNALLEQGHSWRTTSKKQWWIESDIRVSLFNKEFFNSYQDGYTLFGYWISPGVVWKPTANLLLKAGVWNGLQYGVDGFGRWQPTLSIVYFNNDWKVIAGTLEGNLNHRMLEPMMDFERVLLDPVENGLQLKYSKGLKFWDVWVDWQQNTGPGKSQQELIWAGQHLSWPLITSDSFWQFHLDLQTTAYHAGGQNLAVPFPVRTWINGSLGLRLKRKIGAMTLECSPYVLGMKEDEQQGWALYPTMGIQWKNWQWWAMYWSGDQYDNPMGGDLFQNYSRKFGTPGLIPGKREWLLLRIYWEKQMSNQLVFSLRLEPVFDFKSGQLEHSAGIYLKYPLAIP